jgi:formamidopyrimidine-DNA glycosylase
LKLPELPEVEYVARQLRQTLVGRTIADVRVNWPRTIVHPEVATFCAELPGARVLSIDRRAKFLLISLGLPLPVGTPAVQAPAPAGGDTGATPHPAVGEQALVIHRRMTGNLLLVPAANGHSPWEMVDDPYCRVIFLLDDSRRLVFTDPRKFGRIALYPAAELSRALGGLGLEPLSQEFTTTALARLLAGRARQMKPLLLDQACIAGIGNIYADEALFQAGIHPLRQAQTLTPDEVARLHTAIREVLTLGIEHGGTTFGRHQDIWGEAGRNRDHLAVYQRAGAPCLRCGTPLVRVVVAQRGTHFCPTCQPLPQSDAAPSQAPDGEKSQAMLTKVPARPQKG